MKKIFFVAAMAISLTAFSQQTTETKKVGPPEGKALVGDSYGENLKASVEKKAISPEKLAKKLHKKGKVEHVVVKGTVTDVCEKKGCWLTVETENNERFFVKMKDYAFFVPTALKGKNVVMEGRAEEKTISVDELKHYATDAKKSQDEIDAITKPEKEIRFVANGIKVVD